MDARGRPGTCNADKQQTCFYPKLFECTCLTGDGSVDPDRHTVCLKALQMCTCDPDLFAQAVAHEQAVAAATAAEGGKKENAGGKRKVGGTPPPHPPSPRVCAFILCLLSSSLLCRELLLLALTADAVPAVSLPAD